MNNLFQRLCSVRSFLLSRKHYYLFATCSFHFCTGQAKLNQANFYSIHFLKVRYFPGNIDNKPLPGVFLEASLPLQQTFKTVLRPILFVARLTASRPKKLVPLAKKLVKLDSAVVSMVFQELCHLVAIFLDCSSSCPCRSPLISKPTLCKTILWSSFVLESCTKTEKLFFLLWRHSLPGENSEYYTCRPRCLSNSVISLVQQRHAYQVLQDLSTIN